MNAIKKLLFGVGVFSLLFLATPQAKAVESFCSRGTYVNNVFLSAQGVTSAVFTGVSGGVYAASYNQDVSVSPYQDVFVSQSGTSVTIGTRNDSSSSWTTSGWLTFLTHC